MGKEAIVSAIQELRDTQYKLLSDARNDVQGGWPFSFIITNYNNIFFKDGDLHNSQILHNVVAQSTLQ